MRENICTVPINEIFEQADGCPICGIHKKVEEKIIDYVMGPAMMEPGLREMTNQTGFCYEHFLKMIQKQNRLGLGLILESHLKEVKKSFSLNKPFKKETCFVCGQIEWGMSRLKKTLYRLYEQEGEFRALFNSQPRLCLPHYKMLVYEGKGQMAKKAYRDFFRSATEIAVKTHEETAAELMDFCSMFDYRNNQNSRLKSSKNAIERAVWYLSSKNPDEAHN